jgi:hypothetical protein
MLRGVLEQESGGFAIDLKTFLLSTLSTEKP